MAYEKDSESAESLLSSEDIIYSRDPRRRRTGWTLTIANVVLFLISISLFVTTLRRKASLRSALTQTSYYSPVWDTLDLNTVVKQTDGSLFEWPHASRWRDGSRPNKTVDDAWYEFEEFRTFPITAEDVRKLGKDPELAVKYPVDYGYGDDAYVAELDIFHQIHCLNLLRQTAWVEFDRNESHGKRPYSEVHWIHLSHCTDILLQNIMCTGNLDVVTFNWMESQTLPFPDFFVNHQCRDFDQIVKWNLEHTVPVKQTRNFTRPKSGYKEVPISKEFYRIYGFDEEEVHASFAHAQGGH